MSTWCQPIRCLDAKPFLHHIDGRRQEVKSVLVSVEEVKDVKNDLVSRSGFEAGVVIHWSFRIVSRATALSQEK